MYAVEAWYLDSCVKYAVSVSLPKLYLILSKFTYCDYERSISSHFCEIIVASSGGKRAIFAQRISPAAQRGIKAGILGTIPAGKIRTVS